MQRFAGLKSGESSLFVLNRGLPEYEVYQRDESVLAITLHRGVSIMGKPDLDVRPGRPSGVEVPTPDAESLGILRREYSLITGGNLSFHEIVSEADCYTAPPLAVQNRLNIDKITAANKDFFKYLSLDNLKSVIAESLSGVQPGRRGFLRLKRGGLSVSAVRKALSDDSVILRLFNPGENTVTDEVLSVLFPHGRLSIVNLIEDEIEELSGDGEYVLPEVKSNTQITIKITREVSDT
jgi:mannosylglycerate hydrolase